MFERSNEHIRTAYRTFYASEHGKVILDDLCTFVGIDSPDFNPEDPNPLKMAFRSGLRQVVLYMFDAMDTSLKKEIEDNVGVEREFE